MPFVVADVVVVVDEAATPFVHVRYKSNKVLTSTTKQQQQKQKQQQQKQKQQQQKQLQ